MPISLPMTKTLPLAAAACALLATGALAEGWTLDGAASRLAFGSVKNDVAGEVHGFTGLSGTVSPDGDVSIDIDLTSVQTNIDIRNERMNEHVFGGLKAAGLTTELDMAELNALPVGEMMTTDVFATLSFLGQDIDVDTQMLVARLGEDKVLVTTNDMLYVEVEDLGITPGIDKLMEIAGLDGITRTVPVTLRFVFTTGDQGS